MTVEQNANKIPVTKNPKTHLKLYSHNTVTVSRNLAKSVILISLNGLFMLGAL